jgi:putative transcriptional regulator
MDYWGIDMRTRIKEYRAKYDMTQEDLAKKVGVRRETILFLEKGKYNPSLRLARDISKKLNASIEEIFLFEEDSDEQGT